MGRAICTALLVFAAGFLGSVLGEAGCILLTASVMTGCIVYELESIRKEKQNDENRE
jgi:hypothetical protein